MIPARWHRSPLRLYIVAAVPWAMWFGYAANEAHRAYSFNRDYVEAVDRTPGADRRNYMIAALNRDEFQDKRNAILAWLLAVPLGFPVFILAGLWVAFGFNRE